MPELPEVETMVRSLSRALTGRVVTSWVLYDDRVLRHGNKTSLDGLIGSRIVKIRRRGKLIIMEFEGEMSLVTHLKMTGQFSLTQIKTPLEKHTRFSLSFSRGTQELRFRDVRKFGYLACMERSALSQMRELSELGPEPLPLSHEDFVYRIRRRKSRLKPLLLNQKFVAGIGNIYADEILFLARLHPLRTASSLRSYEIQRMWKAMREVLMTAIRHKGSSIRDYRDAQGMEGNYQNLHRVYGRKSQPCRECGNDIVRFRVGGRSTFVCRHCQPEDPDCCTQGTDSL